jgi:hypothetical protein
MTSKHNCADPDCDGVTMKMRWLKRRGAMYLVCDTCASIQIKDLRTGEQRWLTQFERLALQAAMTEANNRAKRRQFRVVS